MSDYECGRCGHVGPAKAAITDRGWSNPWCSMCGRNDSLELCSEEDDDDTRNS